MYETFEKWVELGGLGGFPWWAPAMVESAPSETEDGKGPGEALNRLSAHIG